MQNGQQFKLSPLGETQNEQNNELSPGGKCKTGNRWMFLPWMKPQTAQNQFFRTHRTAHIGFFIA